MAPTIFGLAALALVLPSVVLRWPRGGHPDAEFTWFDLICAALFGATAGWFVATAAAWHAADPHTAVLSAIAGALIAASAAAVALLRKPRSATRPQRRQAVSRAGNRSAKRWYSSGRL